MKKADSQLLERQFSPKSLAQFRQQNDSIDTGSQKQRMFGQEYSFNRDQSQNSKSRSNIYLPCSAQQSEISVCSNPDLFRKYFSIYQSLKDVDSNQIMQLFLEELQDHQKTRKKLFSTQRSVKNLQQQANQLKDLLNSKRQSIAQLCQSQSNHLNIIQQLEGQMKNKCFSAEGHFQKKYKQLQTYMNQYIASTNEAQEQIFRNFKLLKVENAKLITMNENYKLQILQQNKKIQIYFNKLDRLQRTASVTKQKEMTFSLSINNLQQECCSLKQQNEALKQNLKATQQFQVELTKQNKELSSELDFIRQKINQNQNISKQIFQKIQEQNQQSFKLSRDLQVSIKQKQKLQQQYSKALLFIEEVTKERQENLKDRESITSHCQQITTQLQSIRTQLQAVRTQLDNQFKLNENLKEHIEKLKKDIQTLVYQHQQLIEVYQQQKQSKQMIKQQLLQLADQVRYMQHTYKKELTQNQKIKQQLHKFWRRRDNPLTEINSNSNRLNPSNRQKNHLSERKQDSAGKGGHNYYQKQVYQS